MKLTHPLLFIALLAAVATIASWAPAVRASSGCPDDPERCVERGAAVPHRVVAVVNVVRSVPTPAPSAVSTGAPARMPVSKPVAKKPAAKVTRPAPSISAPTPATPGMGMLLKMSSGTGGEVSWFPSRPVETSGASWIL